MVRGRVVGSGVVRSRLVGRGRVVRSGLVGGGGVVRSGLGISVILDISDKARVIINSVGHGLGTAVGEEDGVLAVGVVAIPVLVSLEVGAGVVIMDSVAVVVVGRGVVVLRGGVVGGRLVGRGRVVGSRGIGSRGVGRGSRGNSHDSGEGSDDLRKERTH